MTDWKAKCLRLAVETGIRETNAYRRGFLNGALAAEDIVCEKASEWYYADELARDALEAIRALQPADSHSDDADVLRDQVAETRTPGRYDDDGMDGE
jgi:hypothetical protein